LDVHQATGRAGLGDHARQLRIEVEAADVVDEHGARLQHLTRDGRLGGVHRERDLRAGAQSLDHGQHAGQLLPGGDGL
jgi:hypothetical protein